MDDLKQKANWWNGSLIKKQIYQKIFPQNKTGKSKWFSFRKNEMVRFNACSCQGTCMCHKSTYTSKWWE
jgi:hypothetical protein